MQVSFKLYPNQMLDLGMALVQASVARVRQSAETYVEDLTLNGVKTGLTLDTKGCLLSYEGSRADFQPLVALLFSRMPTPIYKLFQASYENEGKTWLKPWETQDHFIQVRGNPRNVFFAMRDSCDAKNPEKHVNVDTVKLADRLNLTKLVKMVKAEDWTKAQASYSKDDLDVAKAIATYDKRLPEFLAPKTAPASEAVAA